MKREAGTTRRIADPKIVDYLTVPINDEPVEVLGYLIPKKFKSFFLVRDEGSRRNWSAEWLMEIGAEGTPKVIEVTPRGLSNQVEIWINGNGMFLFRDETDSVSPRQIEILHQHYRRFIVASLQIAIQVHTYEGDGKSHKWTVLSKTRDISRKDLSAFEKEIINRSAKRRLTPEFLKKVEREHSQEVKRVKRTGEKLKVNEILAVKYLVSVKTIESWLVKAKKISPPLTKKVGKLVPAKKKTPTKKKGSTNVKKS